MICYRRRVGRNLPAYRDGVLYRYVRADATPPERAAETGTA